MNKYIIAGIVVILVAAGVIAAFMSKQSEQTSGPLDQFTQCLKDSGAVFYGAYWCSHCQNQKKLFGASEKLLPYVECSTPDGKGQLQVCKDKKIEGYPTWEFKDESRMSGEISLEVLAEKTGCQLPQ